MTRCALCGSVVLVERFVEGGKSGTRSTCMGGAHEVEVMDRWYAKDLKARLAKRRRVGVGA